MVFQSYALYPHLTVVQEHRLSAEGPGGARESSTSEVEWAAGLLGIGRLLERKPRELSGGERQRVALARAIVREPAVFLLDEPLSNLDAKLRASAREELEQFQKSLGTTTIYVTHDQVEAMAIGDRVVVMNCGKVRQIGTPGGLRRACGHVRRQVPRSAAMNSSPWTECWSASGPSSSCPPRASAKEEAGPTVAMRFAVDRVEHLGAGRLLYGTLPDHARREDHRQPRLHRALHHRGRAHL